MPASSPLRSSHGRDPRRVPDDAARRGSEHGAIAHRAHTHENALAGRCREIDVDPLPPARLEHEVAPEHLARLREVVARGAEGPRVWTVNSTAAGGGVAEMLRSLVGYARGAGADVRWVVLEGNPAFFRVTKRLHNLLHGHPGDGGRLGAPERAIYEATVADAAGDLLARVAPGDVAILHDPQTAGLVRPLRERGVPVVWRSHVGAERTSPLVHEAWDFLLPYVAEADAFVFSRTAYVPEALRDRRTEIVHPSIDPLSPKNQPLAPAVVRAILEHVGLAAGRGGDEAGPATFTRQDGTPARVERFCEILRTGPPPRFGEPLVTQVSRWDRLKDPVGVLRGFCEHVLDRVPAQLVLAGPNVSSVSDDPEGAEVLDEVEAFWRTLPHAERSRVQLACLPMHDLEENGAIVNALQRQADVVVQKSLQEGFGLTVTEGMWKGRPVVASAVGGIPEQVVDGRTGVLLPDPGDLRAFGSAVADLLEDDARRAVLGAAAQAAVRRSFLHDRHLAQFLELVLEVGTRRVP